MLTGRMRKEKGEKIDIVSVLRKSATPGESLPETTVQSQIIAIFAQQSEDTLSAPITTKAAVYTCYLFEGMPPKVAQILKRNTGEQLSIITEPKHFNGMIYFKCQHLN